MKNGIVKSRKRIRRVKENIAIDNKISFEDHYKLLIGEVAFSLKEYDTEKVESDTEMDRFKRIIGISAFK